MGAVTDGRETPHGGEVTLESGHFSQTTLDLLRERTDGAFLITGRQGMGGNYSRLSEYLVARRTLIRAGYGLSHS